MTDVSICMATYNGAIYLRAQLDSILSQMREGDELIVLDDASKDGTLDIVLGYEDARIRVHRNDFNLGHVQTFSKVLCLASKKFIFMADQDDIWVEGRLDLMRKALNTPGIWLVSSNSKFIDAGGGGICAIHPDLNPADSGRNFVNIFRIFTGSAFYDGCSMAFRKELATLVLPIPAYVESHDLWIAMGANLVGVNLHLRDVTLLRRVHGRNASVVRRPLFLKLWSRIVFALSIAHLLVRRFRMNQVLS